MISFLTNLVVTDNTGALHAQCIKILGQSGSFARLGDRIVLAIKRVRPEKKIKRHEVRIGVVIRGRRRSGRPNGMGIAFAQNAVAITDTRNAPQGSRILGAAPQELRTCRRMKFLVIAQRVL